MADAVQEASAREQRTLLADLERRFRKAAQARRPFDVEWTLDVAFYNGLQYTEYNNTTRRFQTVPSTDTEETRCIDNRIQSLVMDTYSMATDLDPAVEVQPLNVDSLEISKARVAQAYLDHITFPTQADWLAARDRALFWVAVCGEGWIKGTYSPQLGRPDIESCSPLSVYLQPNIGDDYRRARWIIETRAMDPDDVYERWGVDVPPNEADSRAKLETQILREMGMVSGNPTVTVKELWELPGRRHPRGRYVVWTSDRILENRPAFPYRHLMLPYAQIGHSPIPDTPHFTSGTKTARPLQMELNAYHSQKTDYRKDFANGKWFIDSTMQLDHDPDDSRAQVMRGDTRGGLLPPPALIQPVAWADSQDGAWIEESFQNAVGIHAASMGQAPGRVDSASGIEALQEGDRGRLAKTTATLNSAMSRTFAQILELAQEFVSEEVLIPLYSANGAQHIHAFKTSDFPRKPLVKVSPGGGLPKNKAARRQEIIAMWSAGLLGADPAKALQMLDFPADMNLTGNELEEMVARNENMLIMQGTPVVPRKWQNHELHRRIHNELRNTAEFDASTNTVWSVMDHHMEETDAAELVEMQEEAARQFAVDKAVEAVSPPDPTPVPPANPTAPDPALLDPAGLPPPAAGAPGSMGAAPAPTVQPT